jgi:hypothetical protein
MFLWLTNLWEGNIVSGSQDILYQTHKLLGSWLVINQAITYPYIEGKVGKQCVDESLEDLRIYIGSIDKGSHPHYEEGHCVIITLLRFFFSSITPPNNPLQPHTLNPNT